MNPFRTKVLSNGDEKMIVMKFGGAALGTRARLDAVVQQIALARRAEKVVVVVSAVGDTTDWLVRDDLDPATKAEALLREHEHAMDALPRVAARRLRESIQELPESAASMTQAELHAFGEVLSSDLVTALLVERGIVARDVALSCVAVRPDDTTRVDEPRTLLHLSAAGLTAPDVQVLVVGGFAGRDRHGTLHLLGRGGSDTSATAIGAAVGARVVELWKNVGGIHAADPNEGTPSTPIASLQWEEADAIARSSMCVLHEGSIEPAWRAGIPIHIRKVGQPELPGTWIEGGRTFTKARERVA